MIWLTWRQFRAQAIAAAAALAVAAVAFAVTGPHLAHLYDTSTSAGNFLTDVNADTTYKTLDVLGIVVLFLAPALIGVFWGAPLITRELETGTFRLAWNQSVTRTRWAVIKVGLIGLASMATAGLLSLMLTWWASPIDTAAGLTTGHGGSLSLNRLTPFLFATRGITPHRLRSLRLRPRCHRWRADPPHRPHDGGHPRRVRLCPDRHADMDTASPHRARPRHLGAQSRSHRPVVHRDEQSDEGHGGREYPRGVDPLQPKHHSSRSCVHRPGHSRLPEPDGLPGGV
jgi:hypothetical protein